MTSSDVQLTSQKIYFGGTSKSKWQKYFFRSFILWFVRSFFLSFIASSVNFLEIFHTKILLEKTLSRKDNFARRKKELKFAAFKRHEYFIKAYNHMRTVFTIVFAAEKSSEKMLITPLWYNSVSTESSCPEL